MPRFTEVGAERRGVLARRSDRGGRQNGRAPDCEPEPRAMADQRLHALDALRGVAMLLGLVLHAALPFMRGEVAGAIPFFETDVAFWPVADRARDSAFDLLVYVIHAFRMPTFFLMAGFFARLVYRRHGPRGFLEHRSKRILLPFLVGLLVIVPFGYGVWYYGWLRSTTEEPGYAAAVAHYAALTGGRLEPVPMHLWFLEYLLLLYAVTLLLGVIARRTGLAGHGARLEQHARRALASPGGLFLVSLATLPPMLAMKEWALDVPYSFLPSPPLLAFYGLFYLCGWLLHDQPNLLGRLAARSGAYLAIGILLLLPLLTLLLGPAWQHAAGPQRAALDLLGRGIYAALAWLLTFGLVGLFLRCFARPNPAVQYLSDAAYWIYLVHLPLVVLLNIAIADWDMPGPLKLCGVVSVSGSLLLLSYQLGVRYTIVGRVLHGSRARPPGRAS